MKLLKGKNGTAKVFTDNIEEQAQNQVIGMMDHLITKGTAVRIMPDVHAVKAQCLIKYIAAVVFSLQLLASNCSGSQFSFKLCALVDSEPSTAKSC